MFSWLKSSTDRQLAALASGSRAEREAAVQALVQADRSVVPRVVEALERGALDAARVLILRGERDLDGVAALVADDREPVAQAALGVLRSLGERDRLDRLVRAGGKAADRVRAAEARPVAVPGTSESWLAALESGSAVERQHALVGLLQTEPLPEPDRLERALLPLLEGPSPVADPACRLLARVAGPRAVEPLIRVLGAGRWEAARPLGDLGDRRAVAPLIAALGRRETAGVAARALGQIGDPRAIEPLRALVASWRSEPRAGGEPDAADFARAALSQLGAGP